MDLTSQSETPTWHGNNAFSVHAWSLNIRVSKIQECSILGSNAQHDRALKCGDNRRSSGA